MTDHWIHFENINFRDKKITSYHLDTRDFHCISHEGEDDNSHLSDIAQILKHKENFLYTEEELENMVNKLFEESGGEGKWRMISIDEEHCRGWALKYLRIYRVEAGLVVANAQKHFLRKEVFESPIQKEFLNHH